MLSYPGGEWQANSSLSARPLAIERRSSYCMWWLAFRLYLRFTFRLHLRFAFRLHLRFAFRLYWRFTFCLYLRFALRLYLRFAFRLHLRFVFRLHFGFTFCLYFRFLRGRLDLYGRCLGFDVDIVFVTDMLRREIGKFY